MNYGYPAGPGPVKVLAVVLGSALAAFAGGWVAHHLGYDAGEHAMAHCLATLGGSCAG
jgi:uncharacterized protein YcfJ